MDPTLEEFVGRVVADRRSYGLPSQAGHLAEQVSQATLALLFPHFAPAGRAAQGTVREEIAGLGEILVRFLEAQHLPAGEAEGKRDSFLARLPELQETMDLDARAGFEADPAARSLDEVLLAYPGFLALACYRLAHTLYEEGVVLLPRLITEYAHRLTGIDIHPGATIGRSLAIDHGTGIVIGETTVIGERVRLYQGVTLGALSVRKGLARQKRHPTIEDDVVIYANATILGGETVIGSRSVIGGNVWLTHSVPPGSIVTHGAAIERPRTADEDLMEFHI